MNDKELLAAAARAIGIEVEWGGDQLFQVVKGRRVGRWNPRDDDGDALRLAVKMGLSIIPESGCVDVNGWSVAYYVDHAGDQNAATRCAIVRAAAEIGQALAPQPAYGAVISA